MTILKIRLSQLVGTYGIGAIVDAPGRSLMVCESTWRQLRYIDEKRLSRQLEGRLLCAPMPIIDSGQDDADVFSGSVPLRIFPRFLHCKSCHKIKDFMAWGGASVTECNDCDEPLIPSRLVVACTHGHLDDFPWLFWAHSGGTCSKGGSDRDICIESAGLSTSLRDLHVSCSKCSASRDLGDCMFPGRLAELGYARCRGGRPWASNYSISEECSSKPNEIKVLQRSASNVFFCEKQSVLSIPPYSGKAFKAIEKNRALLEGTSNVDDPFVVQVITRLSVSLRLSVNDLRKAYLSWAKLEDSSSDDGNIREDEFEVLTSPPVGTNFSEDFHAVGFSNPLPDRPFIKSVTLVHRLRVVSAQTGFTRIKQGEDGIVPQIINPLGDPVDTAWLPACEVHGEGIFIQLDAALVNRWLSQVTSDRYDHVLRRASAVSKVLTREKFMPTIPLMALHTFSHLLMNELSVSSGYSNSAISERLYQVIGTDGAAKSLGVLIYTSSSDSEGSLGGLVRQGDGPRLRELIDKAAASAGWCSNDPLCTEVDSVQGQGADGLNLAACHTCALIPETACELSNCFLDRSLLVGTQSFNGLLDFNG